MSTQVSIPFGFFTYDAFRAGWFFLWRLGLYLLPAFVVLLLGGVMVVMAFVSAGVTFGQDSKDSTAMMQAVNNSRFWVGVALIILGWLGGLIASIPLTSKIARGWAQRVLGRTFEGGVWWAITWRVILVSLLASIVGRGVSVVTEALSSSTASAGSNLAGLFLQLVVVALNIVVSLLSYGWAMSKAVARKIGGVDIAPTVIAGLNPLGYMPTTGPQSPVAARPAPVRPMAGPQSPAMAPRTPIPPPPPSGAGPAGRRQCPKCGLYETEKGTVLGWYCKVCGWSESRA